MRLKLTFKILPGGHREAIIDGRAYCIEPRDLAGHCTLSYDAVIRTPRGRIVLERAPAPFKGICSTQLWLQAKAEAHHFGDIRRPSAERVLRP